MRVHTASFAVVLVPTHLAVREVVRLPRAPYGRAVATLQFQRSVKGGVADALIVDLHSPVGGEQWFEKV